MILGICSSPNILETLYTVKIIITVILIAVPSILIFSLIFKLISATTRSDEDAIAVIKKKAIPNVIASILIIIVPTLVNVLVQLAFPDSEYSLCATNTSIERINELYYEIALDKIKVASQTLLLSDYHIAESKVEGIKDDRKDELKDKLKYLKKYVDIMTDIRNLRSTRNYKKLNELRNMIENLYDEDMKEVLLAALEKVSQGLMVYEPIMPDDGERVIKQEETNTLKVYITKTDTYFLTRIWALNPYEQLNKKNAEPYGNTLTRPKALLEKEIKDKGIGGELIVGFNASGFYLRDTYDASSVNYYGGYDKTSVGTLVITDGQVIRNQYEKGDLLTWFIMGVDPDNQMVVFIDKKMRETNKSEKKAWSESVINSGIRNTYTFAAPVILEGKKTNYDNHNSRMPGDNVSKKGLQLICQINNNNFVLFTSSNESRNTAINLFMDLGCQTAVNLDGGGSVALLYKASGSSTIETIVGNGRNLPEVGYFSE